MIEFVEFIVIFLLGYFIGRDRPTIQDVAEKIKTIRTPEIKKESHIMERPSAERLRQLSPQAQELKEAFDETPGLAELKKTIEYK